MKDTIKRYLNQHEYTAVQIFRMISEDGYTGGISILREYITLVRPSSRTAYLALTFAPGESAQVDFGYCGTEEVKKAMEDTSELEVFSADAVLNVLEIRHRSLPEPTPLHLSRKTDCLDIELPGTNLDIYNIK